jgi:ADP-heptose:LPS heptosyltransferase
MATPAHSFAGRLGLAELGALVEEADLVVSNNTGPAHIAAALGTPLVDLYALTNPQHTPWRVESRVLFHDVPCRNCYKSECPVGHHDCLRGVAPESVAAAGRELLHIG